ncbi:MAG: portal protein, partial [Actinomycetota bacterium]
MLSGVPRRIVVIGHDEIGRRTAGMLRDAQADVIHLDEPTDAELREILDRGADGVAVMLHDDIKALRYCLVVHHLDPELPLFVAMFDRTARAQLERVVPECVVLSPASIS